MIKKYIIFIFLFSAVAGLRGYAQEKDKTMPKANQEYSQQKFAEAESNYRISNSKFPKRTVAPFNLGNSIYKQNQNAEAKFAYAKAIENTKSRTQKHKIYHNLGNVFMNEKNYTNAVEAYKNALRNNPSDEETRYNYALAKKKLKENPPKDDKKKDKKDEKKDGEKEKKEDQNKKDKDKEDDKGKDKPADKGEKKDEKPKDEGKPKPMPGGISKQRLENLLEAVNNEEKKIQDKINAQKVKGKPTPAEKDW